MTTFPFEVGGRYRNEHGEHEVIGIEEDHMLVRFDDGKQILLNVAIQTRIWQRIQDEIAPPPALTKLIKERDENLMEGMYKYGLQEAIYCYPTITETHLL